jgi:hypothetical protein
MKILNLLLLVVILTGCGNNPKKINPLVSNFSAVELCKQYTLSLYSASDYRGSLIIEELTKRQISVDDCNKSDFSKYIKDNMKVVVPRQRLYTSESSDEISKLKKDIKKLQNETSRLEIERIIDYNNNQLENIKKERSRREERLQLKNR